MPSPKNTANRSRSAAAPKPPTPATSPATAQPTRAAVPGAELTEFQQLVCNLAGDLIINGGRKPDVENLIKATMSHSLHLRLPWHKNDEWAEESAIDRDLPDWFQRISRHWPEKSKAAKSELPETVSEMIRANLRGDLRMRFEEFLGDARMHELYLLCNVFLSFESRTRGADNDAAESLLAEAFMYEIASNNRYVEVQREHVEMVEQYVALLDKAEPREVASGD